jgi:hypothetical protein
MLEWQLLSKENPGINPLWLDVFLLEWEFSWVKAQMLAGGKVKIWHSNRAEIYNLENLYGIHFLRIPQTPEQMEWNCLP